MALTAESQQRRWEGVVQASRSTGRLQLRGASLDAGSAATVVQLLLSEEKQPWHVDLEGNELGDRGALCVAELLRQSTDLVWLGLGQLTLTLTLTLPLPLPLTLTSVAGTM